jgi:serine/threonine protein kinase
LSEKHENTVVFLVAPGDTLDDRWLIETRIGQGAMGSVFKGHDTKQNRPVAIKILAPEHCRKPKVLARFEREAKLMTTLRHPNIIQIYGVGRRGALPYIVMQFLEGMTLYDVLKHKGGKLNAGETMAVVKQISAGLSFVHHHGLVHRDIKPQNIFVSPGGHITILDLGVVRDKSNPGLTKPGAMVGTPYYMSPEQITGTEEIDKRTDVYALAAMTFELLVGRPPFLGTSNFEVLYAHRTQPAPDASTLAKNVSKDAAKALMRGMGKTREERPNSASEFYADLEAFFGASEKIEPAVAFAFLEEEASKLRAKEKERAARREKEKAGRVPTVVKSTRAPTAMMDRAPVFTSSGSTGAPPVRSSEQALEEEPTGTALPPAHPAQQTGADEEDPTFKLEPEPSTVPGAESPVRDASRETADEDLSDPGPEATVTENGELRIVTTVRGLTTSCSLFIDDRRDGATPCSVQLPEGHHVVRVERAGFKPVEKPVTVRPNEVALVRIELQPPVLR